MVGRIIATALTLLVLAPVAALAAPRELEQADRAPAQIVPYTALAAPMQPSAAIQPVPSSVRDAFHGRTSN